MRDQASYHTIPRFYDAIMAHVDYQGWGDYLRKLWTRAGVEQPQNILELAAGTCPFHRLNTFPENAKVIYTDLSLGMLLAAEGEPRSDGRRAKPPSCRVTTNALHLPFHSGYFDLVLMIYDAFNYLMDAKGAQQALTEIHQVLRPGGIFIFDITTATNSKRHFADVLDYEDLQGGAYIRQSQFDPESNLQENAFTFFVEEPDGRYRRIQEVHQQRIFKVDDLISWATQIGFTITGPFSGFSFRPGTDTSERVHLALRKPEL